MLIKKSVTPTSVITWTSTEIFQFIIVDQTVVPSAFRSAQWYLFESQITLMSPNLL